MQSPFLNSQWVWCFSPAQQRNQVVSFEQTVDLAESGPLTLHLFADTRYRLFVNDEFVAYGPARFLNDFPEYDTFDLRPHFRDGVNRVRVEVNYYGSSSFQSDPGGKPGFIAAGGSSSGSISFVTPGKWMVTVHKAWRADSPHFSFAQNPIEICDRRLLQKELEDCDSRTAPKILMAKERVWGNLSPRSVPYSDYMRVLPVALEIFGELENNVPFGFQSVDLNWNQYKQKCRRIFSTWILSESDRGCVLECFWGDLYCNGEKLDLDISTCLGNHGHVQLNLRPGWNQIVGVFEVLSESWSYLVRLPETGNLVLKAIPDSNCEHRFCLSPVLEQFDCKGVPDVISNRVDLPEGWTLSSGDRFEVTPARLVAWDRVEKIIARDSSADLFAGKQEVVAFSAVWCFRFDKEYYGHPFVTIEAPGGTVMDIAYDDWQRDDGCVNLYGSNPFTDSVDRFILKGGCETVQVMNPRGGIFLQITLRSPCGQKSLLAVRSVRIARSTLLNNGLGACDTGSPIFNYAWDAASATIQASTDEAYTDCPWRERATYVGDTGVAFHLNHALHPDRSIARRTLLNLGRAILPCGQLPPCAPSWLNKPHEDFSLLWILWVRDFWVATGDTQFAHQCWPCVEKILAAEWNTDNTILWNADSLNLFIDWGASPADRRGQGNAAINILRVAALRASACLANVLLLASESNALIREAENVSREVMKLLWRGDQGRFVPNVHSEAVGLHANVWALYAGVGPADQIVQYLKVQLAKNLQRALKYGQGSGYIDLYFLFFLLPGLAEVGEFLWAENLIEEHYGFLRNLGHATLVESLPQAPNKQGSCCHTWSGAGAIYAHRYILGLRQLAPGNPDQFILQPMASERFSSIRGKLHHPLGIIDVCWRRRNDGVIEASVSSPPKVEVKPGPDIELADFI